MITEPGVYYNVPFDEYCQVPAINNSKLVSFAKTPAHSQIEKPDNPAMCRGRVIHAALLEPERYKREWGFMPKGMQQSGLKFEAWRKDHLEAKELAHEQDEEAVKGIVKSLKSGYYETARKDFELWDATEVTLVWRNRKYGCLCKARLDNKSAALGCIGDLKTSTTADGQAWIRMQLNAGMKPHWQAFWYLEGAQEVLGDEYQEFKWMLCETKVPFGIGVLRATDTMLAKAEEELDVVLYNYLECVDKGYWPGRPDKVIDLDLPDYYLTNRRV